MGVVEKPQNDITRRGILFVFYLRKPYYLYLPPKNVAAKTMLASADSGVRQQSKYIHELRTAKRRAMKTRLRQELFNQN